MQARAIGIANACADNLGNLHFVALAAAPTQRDSDITRWGGLRAGDCRPYQLPPRGEESFHLGEGDGVGSKPLDFNRENSQYPHVHDIGGYRNFVEVKPLAPFSFGHLRVFPVVARRRSALLSRPGRLGWSLCLKP
jgi:hypothetical protein